jgi:soluble lytic murein transglycosylase-like protein
MQFRPATANEEKVNRFDVVSSIKGGERYLAKLRDRFGSIGLALAAYNYGPGNLSKWLAEGAKVERLPQETRAYVLSITGIRVEDWLLQRGKEVRLFGHVAMLAPEFEGR